MISCEFGASFDKHSRPVCPVSVRSLTHLESLADTIIELLTAAKTVAVIIEATIAKIVIDVFLVIVIVSSNIKKIYNINWAQIVFIAYFGKYHIEHNRAILQWKHEISTEGN
jgi:hypothetical protein